MLKTLPALVVGVIFGAGLALSEMVNPARVEAFLDVTGAWDPTLGIVMGAAILPSAFSYMIRRRLERPLLETRFFVPEKRTLDRQLLFGAALFGVGWGLVGFCPGPALAALVLGAWQPWLFVLAMIAGMAIHRVASGSSHKPAILPRG